MRHFLILLAASWAFNARSADFSTQIQPILAGTCTTCHGGVKKKAAQLLGISFRSFRYRLEKLGLDGSGSGSL